MPPEPTFVVLKRGERVPPAPRPLFALHIDAWDDFGHKVQFQLVHYSADGDRTRLGAVKILQRTHKGEEDFAVASTTKLSKRFSKLGEEFVSLGQEDGYYKGLWKLKGSHAAEVLEALRDIAWLPALAADYEPTPAFRNAMTRENGAHRARRFGRAWATGQSVTEDPSFSYIGMIEGAGADVEAMFAFDPSDPVPGRIVGIIGRNAVGKTQFLASLGADLAQITRSSAASLRARDDRFPSGRPLFTRIIAISYSAFDRFKRPPLDRSNSYIYCGIRSDRGALSRKSLIESYRRNQGRIRDGGLEARWTSYMQDILGDVSGRLTASLEEEIGDPTTLDADLSLLSSGQAILAHFVTALLAWIQPNSLVLFDEPETHLHPNAVANLFLVLSDILDDFNCFAVVATHSPVVIQEIPANRVLVFLRDEDVTTADPLLLESFGESVTELTRHVFETNEVESVYRRTLRKLAKKESAANVLARFPRGLSMSAQAYLLAQYSKNKKSS